MLLTAHAVSAAIFTLTSLAGLVGGSRVMLGSALGSGVVTIVSGTGLLLTRPSSLSATCLRGLLVVAAAGVMARVGRRLSPEHA